MGTEPEPTFIELFKLAKRSAVHLEMRDGYMRSDPRFVAWRKDPGSVSPERDEDQGAWRELMREVTGRGVEVRRARIVSEPISDYIRFEHHLTADGDVSGEHTRWLPRRKASDLALPGNDFWLFDGELVVFLHFTGDGELSPEGDEERTREPGVVRLCSNAFESVWERGTPHEQYAPS